MSVKFVDNIGLVEAMKDDYDVLVAVKNGFAALAARLADAEDKAERYRLALERCRIIIDDDALWAFGRPVEKMRLIVVEALK